MDSENIKYIEMARIIGGQFLDENNFLWRNINGVMVGKKALQNKNLTWSWVSQHAINK